MYGINPKYLTAADITKLEEAMNAEDLETVVAVVDRIVELRLRAAKKAAKK
jgi:hypothetical protein